MVMDRRANIAGMIEQSVATRLNSLRSLVGSISGDKIVAESIREKKWEEAIIQVRKLEDIPIYDDAFVDRIILVNASGTTQADDPALQGQLGKNLSERPWFLQCVI